MVSRPECRNRSSCAEIIAGRHWNHAVIARQEGINGSYPASTTRAPGIQPDSLVETCSGSADRSNKTGCQSHPAVVTAAINGAFSSLRLNRHL
jgi:hypothetical protein